MVLPATFAQANVLPEPLMQSDVVPATLVESTVLQPLGGESRGRRPRRRVNDDRDEGVVDVRKWCCRSLADDRAACPPRLTVDRAETLLTTFS